MRLFWASVLIAAGCGRGGPEMHPVRGDVTLTGGDAGGLAGHHVEVVSESDPAVRASGVITAGGKFELETLHAGEIHKGVPAGRYRVRVLRGEEGDDGKRLPNPPVATRYLKFESSGLRLDVPAEAPVAFALSPR